MKTLQRHRISKSASLLLDSLRVLASLVVLLHHATQQWLVGHPIAVKQLEVAAHAAVIVFFVLSGYFISFATIDTDVSPRQYAVARLSRLYSVLIPALLFTAIIELAVHILNPQIADQYTRGNSVPRYILSLLFCNEIGWLSAAPPINGPLWSLSYEFWYYAIFGLLFFRGSTRKALLLPIAVCLIAGPKILLLMPIWFFGMMAYRSSKKYPYIKKSWLYVLALFAIAALLVAYMPALPAEIGVKPFFFANQFLKDWLVGGVFALALVVLPSEGAAIKDNLVAIVRHVADLSFPLYILHYPILVLWQAVFGRTANDLLQMSAAIVTSIVVAALIGNVLEKKRPVWSKLFSRLLKSKKLLASG